MKGEILDIDKRCPVCFSGDMDKKIIKKLVVIKCNECKWRSDGKFNKKPLIWRGFEI